MTVKYSMVLGRSTAREMASVRITEIADRCKIHPDVIDRLVRLGLVDPDGRNESGTEWIFPQEAVPLVRKIIRLRNELGVNYAGVGVILDLLSRIEQLESRIRDLEK